MSSEHQEAARPASLLLSETEITRFDRWVEFIAAVVLSLATVATAWAGYQATLWGGEQSDYMAQANAANIRAAYLSNRAMQRSSLHASLFVTWAAAFSEENSGLADFLYERFPAELKVAADAWIATRPRENPDAPKSPFAMAEYVLPEYAASEAASAEALAASARAEAADQVADRYVLLTVIFASVLFFGGISGKFQSKFIDLGMLGISIIVFLIGIGILVTYPIQ